MAVTAGAVVPLDARRRRRHDLLAELREVDHWRRLVTARLDLAVAAVTALEEPAHRHNPGPGLESHIDAGTACEGGSPLPAGLREILGLPVCDPALPDAALPEAALLLRLRAAQRDLGEYAHALRAAADLSTLELSTVSDLGRHRRAPRCRREDRARHLVAVPGPDLPFTAVAAVTADASAAADATVTALKRVTASTTGSTVADGTEPASAADAAAPVTGEKGPRSGPTVPGGTARSTDTTP